MHSERSFVLLLEKKFLPDLRSARLCKELFKSYTIKSGKGVSTYFKIEYGLEEKHNFTISNN